MKDMKEGVIVNNITEETLAAYFDGNVTSDEFKDILDGIASSAELQEIMAISLAVDRDLALGANHAEVLPIVAVAASTLNGTQCCLECEKYILRRRGIEFDEAELETSAKDNKWQKRDGTALHNIGRHLESLGLGVTRRFKCRFDDIIAALRAGEDIIVAVDGGELTGDLEAERREDIFIGEIPDHTVVILACNTEEGTITLFDPNSPNAEDVYPIEQFRDAWEDSKNYMVTAYRRGEKEYRPSPIDLSDVVLKDDISELREAIAENAHELWAKQQMAEGWSYGETYDDKKRLTPDMVPFAELSESKRRHNRDMAMHIIKLMHKLGYDILKYHNTQLYADLRAYMLTSDNEAVCPRCGATLYVGQRYCDRCGEKIAR